MIINTVQKCSELCYRVGKITCNICSFSYGRTLQQSHFWLMLVNNVRKTADISDTSKFNVPLLQFDIPRLNLFPFVSVDLCF